MTFVDWFGNIGASIEQWALFFSRLNHERDSLQAAIQRGSSSAEIEELRHRVSFSEAALQGLYNQYQQAGGVEDFNAAVKHLEGYCFSYVFPARARKRNPRNIKRQRIKTQGNNKPHKHNERGVNYAKVYTY